MIINSLLDEDLYKFSMQKIYFRKYNDVWAKYEFRCRTENIFFTPLMIEEITKEIDCLCELTFTEEEIKYLMSLPWLNAIGYKELLRLFKLNRKYITISDLNKNQEKKFPNNLKIVAEGPIWIISMFEIFVLSIVNEIYFKYVFREKFSYAVNDENIFSEGKKLLEEKIKFINGNPFPLTEFGTRRRFSHYWQNYVIRELKEKVPTLTGTSNVYFAMKFGLKPLGTMAHEFICMPQGLGTNTVAESQKVAFNSWMEEYRGDLGIALTDTLGQEKFLKDFDKLYANAFTGVRHDSGDPIEWGEQIIEHYQKLGVDPRTKTLMFSDSLDFTKAYFIYKHFKDKCKLGFGIGTYLTNDVGIKPLNIVYKLVEVQHKPVAKLSNVDGKVFCNDDDYVEYLKKAIR